MTSRPILILIQLALHVGLVALLTLAIDDALFRWEFWIILLTLFTIEVIE